jgi:alanine racemase
VRQQLSASGLSVPLFHLANSAATMFHPSAHHDAVRVGIAMYGQYPSNDVPRNIRLEPAMSMKTRIIHLKEVPAGTGLSYGHTHVTQRPTRVATVALGYADGYPRHASNTAQMLVHGRAARVLGRVCMDLTLLDVTDVPEAKLGEEAVAFGRSGDALLRPEDMAAAIGTIGYEITTRVGKRLPRVYEG